MTKTATIPAKPVNGDWFAWVQNHYPFDPRWEHHICHRTERERPGSAEELNDLRGLRDRHQAAELAQMWFYVNENAVKINAAREADRAVENLKDRARLIRLAKTALEGHLGDTREQRDDAQATAQTYLRQPPEHCSDDDLHDWEKMHAYAKRVAVGCAAKQRPRLAADVRAEREKARSLADMHDSIGAVNSSKPRAEQIGLGGEW